MSKGKKEVKDKEVFIRIVIFIFLLVVIQVGIFIFNANYSLTGYTVNESEGGLGEFYASLSPFSKTIFG